MNWKFVYSPQLHNSVRKRDRDQSRRVRLLRVRSFRVFQNHCEASMINNVSPPSKSVSRGKPTPTALVVLARSGRTLPPGYIHLGVIKEVAPVLRDYGIDP